MIARNDGRIDYLGPDGLFGQALSTRPARPGEIIELFATALGPTDPAVPAGAAFAGAASVVDPVTATIGGITAQVSFAGVVGAGLYQVNLAVPSLPPGEHALLIKVNGVSSQQGVLVAVGR